MNKKIIFSLLALTIIIIGTVFLFTSNILVLNTSQLEELTKSETIESKIIISDKIPISDEINTKCEWIEFLIQSKNRDSIILTILENNHNMELQYFDKGGKMVSTIEESVEAHSLLKEISAEIIVENYEIDPKLTHFVKDTLVEDESDLPIIIQKFDLNCNSYPIDNFIKKHIPKDMLPVKIELEHISISEINEQSVILNISLKLVNPNQKSSLILQFINYDLYESGTKIHVDQIGNYLNDNSSFYTILGDNFLVVSDSITIENTFTNNFLDFEIKGEAFFHPINMNDENKVIFEFNSRIDI